MVWVNTLIWTFLDRWDEIRSHLLTVSAVCVKYLTLFESYSKWVNMQGISQWKGQIKADLGALTWRGGVPARFGLRLIIGIGNEIPLMVQINELWKELLASEGDREAKC